MIDQLYTLSHLPPLPEAQTKMLPLPLRPVETPCTKARAASRPGPSTVLPSSSGPQLIVVGVKSDVRTQHIFSYRNVDKINEVSAYRA